MKHLLEKYRKKLADGMEEWKKIMIFVWVPEFTAMPLPTTCT